MSSEIFKKVEDSEMPEVLKSLEKEWPKHFILHQLLTVLDEYKKSGCKWEHSLYLSGDYDKGVYLSKMTIQLPDKEMISLYIDTTHPDLSVTQKSLMETKLIPWEKKNYTFNHIHSKFTFLIQTAFTAKKLICEISPNTMYWFPPSKDSKLEPLPDDTTVDLLDGSFAGQMDSNWPHKYPGSDLVLQEHLEKNFGLGLFRKSDRKLIVSALSNHSGGIFVLFSDPRFRGMGYATILVKHMVQEIRKRGRIPFCTVILGNKPSEHVFRNAGFEVFADADYILAATKK